MPDLLLPAASAHEQQFRQRALQAVIALSLVTSVFALIVGFPLGWNVGIKLGLVFLIVKNLGFLLWLRTFPAQYAVAGGLHFLILAATGLYKFAQATLAEEVVRGLGSYSYWLPLVYVVAFLAFRGRRALVACALVFAALLAIAVTYMLTAGGPEALKRENSVLLVQLLLAHATFISFFVLFSVLQGRYVQALSEAQTEARAAYVDVLTGVANRRQLTQWLAARLDGGPAPLSVILLDLDHFKQINDTHGHDTGDEVLRAAATAVGTSLRRGTLFGRWGGEEFLVILPGAGLLEAQGVAERIRLGVAGATYPLPVQVTVSLGVAQARDGERPESVLKRADQALYAAKHAGRNQVQAA